jgi:signal transduction histidine kinase
LTSELSPPVLYSFGFVPAVEWLVGQFQELHGIRFEFRNDGELKPMDEETQVLLFRITRELLFNVLKHSQARNRWVSISKDGNSIQIVVKDDGVGFDASTLFNNVDSFGFFSIRERLKYLGGRIEVASEPGKGTKVVLSARLKQSK